LISKSNKQNTSFHVKLNGMEVGMHIVIGSRNQPATFEITALKSSAF
jgi:hypothetical protein